MQFQESETVELNEVYVEEIRKEIIAFANSNGGTVYVGVRDNGEITGLEDPDSVALQISNGCRDAVKPDITMFVAYHVTEINSRKILEVHVQRGTARPYYLSAKGLKPSGVFVRQGFSSVPASDEAIRRMIKETDGDEFESMRSLNQDLTFVEAEKAFKERNLVLKKTQMRTLGMISDEDVYTNLALLLSDQCPHIIKTATFEGITQEEFQDRREFTGSLLKQLSDAYGYLDLRNRTRATFDRLLRIDIKDYPDTALREALLNAVIHRDYSNPAGTIISVYGNRVEFISYGGLTGNVTLEDVLYGLSVCRNRKLADIFYRLKLIEAYGTGLQKIQNSYKSTKYTPEFMAGPNSFKVVLPNVNSEEKETVTEMQDADDKSIIRFIREKGESTRSEIQKALGLTASTTIRRISGLKASGKLKSVGSGKNTKYVLPSSDE